LILVLLIKILCTIFANTYYVTTYSAKSVAVAVGNALALAAFLLPFSSISVLVITSCLNDSLIVCLDNNNLFRVIFVPEDLADS